jgi:hypothetical protein
MRWAGAATPAQPNNTAYHEARRLLSMTITTRNQISPSATLTAGMLAGFRCNLGKPRRLPCPGKFRRVVARLTRRVGARLFAANDTEAGWRGWESYERHLGLSRRYRDLRFARREARPEPAAGGD